MSDEDSDAEKTQKIDEMPPFKMRFTDMQPETVEKAIRCK